jgi:hypothetical protein
MAGVRRFLDADCQAPGRATGRQEADGRGPPGRTPQAGRTPAPAASRGGGGRGSWKPITIRSSGPSAIGGVIMRLPAPPLSIDVEDESEGLT